MWSANETLGDFLSYSETATYRGNLGVLKIDNGILTFTKRSGLINQREYVIQTIPVNAIRSMDIQGIRRNKLVIMVDSSKISGIPRHEFDVSAPDYWINIIQSEMRMDSQKAIQPPQPTIIKETVKEIVKIPCPYCGSLVDITWRNCGSCGAPLPR
jgi:hypothetical protein